MKINTVIIGIQKAGTTSFYNWLAQHPDIYAPARAKDFHFFSDDKYFNKGIDNLLDKYKDYKNEKIILHSGVNYSYFHSYTYQRLKEYNPDLKIIIILRNPTERAISAYNYFKRLTIENRPIEEAFNLNNEKLLDGHHSKANSTYLQHGFYSKQILALADFFPQKNIKIIFFEDILVNKKETYSEVLDFLEVDNSFRPEFTHENVSGAAKLKFVNKILWDEKIKNKIKRIFPYHKFFNNSIRSKIFLKLNKLNTNKSKSNEIPKNLITELNSVYKEEVEQLSQLLNIDLQEKWQIK